MTVAVAGAPCNVGVAADPNAAPPSDVLLDALEAGGYVGVDLGPPGYLAGRGELGDRLRARGFGLAGGWVQLGVADTLDTLAALLDACDAARVVAPHHPRPRPTVGPPPAPAARIGSPTRLDDAEMDHLAAALGDLAGRCRARGHEPVLHPHVGTTIETPEDTGRLLERSDVDLCFDTGHVQLGGGDPLTLLRQWRDRISHVHLKDVDEAIAARLRDEEAATDRTWDSGVFCELGTGDLDLAAAVTALGDFSGWVVIEQDRAVQGAEETNDALAAQARNRRRLAEVGW